MLINQSVVTLVFEKCSFSFGKKTKPNCRLCWGLGVGFQENLKNNFVVIWCAQGAKC
jgi:hypothetical protein